MDFDLTLYDYRNPPATMNLLPWFTRLAQHGVRAGIASGRDYADLRKTVTELGFEWANPFPGFVICEEGVILDIHGQCWPGAKEWNSNRAQRIAEGNRKAVVIFEDLVRWAQDRGIPVTRPILATAAGVNVVFDTPESGAIVLEELRTRLAGEPELVAARNHHLVLALPHGTDKGAAVAELARLCKLDPSQVLTIGDNLNDWSMLCDSHGFRPATVANAVPEIIAGVRRRGGIVAQAEISDGIAEIFEQVFASVA